MQTITRQLMGSEKVITYRQFAAGDHVLVGGKPGMVRWNPGSNALAVFLPSTPAPLEIMGRSAVGQWRDQWASVSVSEANLQLMNMAQYDWWEQRYGRPAILPNETDTKVDYDAWMHAFDDAYARS